MAQACAYCSRSQNLEKAPVHSCCTFALNSATLNRTINIMGAVSSCCTKEEAEQAQGVSPGGEGSEFNSVAVDEVHTGKDAFDQELMPFQGEVVLLKFTSKSSYSERFVWLNDSSKMIHMSEQHKNAGTVDEIKQKRHKEANLSDVSIFCMLLFYIVVQKQRYGIDYGDRIIVKT